MDTPTDTQTAALDAAQQGRNILITGKAGSGKTAWVNAFCKGRLGVARTAMTGVAACLISGETLHRFAKINQAAHGCKGEELFKELRELHAAAKKIDDAAARDAMAKKIEAKTEAYLEEASKHVLKSCFKKYALMKGLDTVIVDECSMMSRYIFRVVDRALQKLMRSKKPWGGLQVILVGDLRQLPPVAPRDTFSPHQAYFFEDPLFETMFGGNCFHFDRVFRQANKEFAALLGRVAEGAITQEDAKLLRSRVVAPPTDAVRLMGKNDMAAEHNTLKMSQIQESEVKYAMKVDCEVFTDAQQRAEQDSFVKTCKRNCLAEEKLTLKLGAFVMLLCNLDVEHGLANGTCGHIIDFDCGYPVFAPVGKQHRYEPPQKRSTEVGSLEVRRKRFAERGAITLTEHAWQFFSHNLGPVTLEQIPLKPAWAITIHKSQGQQYTRVVADLSAGSCFAAGQAYVALSRAESLDGLYLTGFDTRAIKADKRALGFYEKLASK